MAGNGSGAISVSAVGGNISSAVQPVRRGRRQGALRCLENFVRSDTKMKRKGTRILAFLLVAMMVLTACGGGNNQKNSTPGDNSLSLIHI